MIIHELVINMDREDELVNVIDRSSSPDELCTLVSQGSCVLTHNIEFIGHDNNPFHWVLPSGS